jgi:hypothetical protein
LRELQDGPVTRARIRAWQAQIVRNAYREPESRAARAARGAQPGPGARAITERLFRPLIASGESAADGGLRRSETHERLRPWIVMGFNNIVMSYVTMAPLYGDLLGIEPLSLDAAERRWNSSCG